MPGSWASLSSLLSRVDDFPFLLLLKLKSMTLKGIISSFFLDKSTQSQYILQLIPKISNLHMLKKCAPNSVFSFLVSLTIPIIPLPIYLDITA